MTTSQAHTEWPTFSASGVGGFQIGDEPSPDYLGESVSRTYYAGTSRHIHSASDLVKVTLLLLLTLGAAVFVTHSVDAKVCSANAGAHQQC